MHAQNSMKNLGKWKMIDFKNRHFQVINIVMDCKHYNHAKRRAA